jgi:hypothetical protein
MNLGLINTWMFGGKPLSAKIEITLGRGGDVSFDVRADFARPTNLTISWDGIEETITLQGQGSTMTTISHSGLADGAVIKIINPQVIRGISIYDMDAVDVYFPPKMPILDSLTLSNLPNLETFITRSPWIVLQTFNLLSLPNLTNIMFYKEWRNMSALTITDVPLSSVSIFPEWRYFRSFSARNIPTLSIVNISITQLNLTSRSFVIDGSGVQNCNDILIAMDGHWRSGYVDLSGGTNSYITGAGLIAADNLMNLGVQLAYNS